MEERVLAELVTHLFSGARECKGLQHACVGACCNPTEHKRTLHWLQHRINGMSGRGDCSRHHTPGARLEITLEARYRERTQSEEATATCTTTPVDYTPVH